MAHEMIEETIHRVSIEAHVPDEHDAEATVKTNTYADGSSGASMLSPDQLREVAETLTDVADRMEDHD